MEQKIGVAYARFSSDKQNQTSIEVQIEQIEKFCAKNNIILIEKYIDEAQSGTNDKRKNFQRMIQDSQSGLFQFVIVHRNDRWARNIEDAMYYKKVLSQRGIKVLSVIESFDTKTAEGNFFNIVSLGMAEMYSKKLARESWEGLLATAHKCGVIGGNPPFGYRIAGHGKNKFYEIVPEEAEIIKEMFEEFLKGNSYNEIYENLKSKFNLTNFSKSTMIDRLRNSRYKGEYVFNQQPHRTEDNKKLRHQTKDEKDIIRIPNGYPKIVEPEVFDKVQQILNNRRQRKIVKKNSPYLLNSFIKCGICGHAVVGSTAYTHQHSYIRQVYTCSNQSLKSCGQKPINLAILDTYINKLFLNVFLKVENVKWLKELIVNLKNDKIKNNLEKIGKNLKTMEDIQQMIESKENEKSENQFSSTTIEFLEDDIKNLQKDYLNLINQNQTLKEQNKKLDVEITLERLKKNIRKLKPQMTTPYLETKRGFLKFALNKISLFREKFIVNINLWWLVEEDYNNELADDLIVEIVENRDNFTYYTFDENKINIDNLKIIKDNFDKM